MDTTIPENPNDHDLLIELRTEMRGLRSDLKTLSDGLSTRVTNLENQKQDKIDAEKESIRICALAESKAKEIFSIKTDEDKDHEVRLRIIESNVTKIMTWGSAAIILIGIAEFLISKFL